PLMPGAGPLSLGGGGPAGVLLLHGFTGTPWVMRPTAERLAARGLNVELPLLPGHGTAVADMVPTRWTDWADAAERSYAALAARSERVAVVGFSMGGTLACMLGARHGSIVGLALVNPFVQPPDDHLRTAVHDLVKAGVELAPPPPPGTARAPSGRPDVADPSAPDFPTYEETPLAPLLSLFEGVEEVALGLASISCPVLLLSSREDHVVPPSNGDLLVASVAGPAARVWLERSFHNAWVDYDRQEVEDRVAEFVVSVTAESPDDLEET
ncbi:MAG: alpha/beta hydrolase, partial [Acidimicrobiales bacterium]